MTLLRTALSDVVIKKSEKKQSSVFQLGKQIGIGLRAAVFILGKMQQRAYRCQRVLVDGIKAYFQIVNAQMSDLIRKSTIEMGHDPRDCVLIAYGGSGPTHAAFYGADIAARTR